MAFEKIATFSHKCKVTALNRPKGWEIFNLPNQIKTASTKYAEENEDLNGFDLKTATAEHPDHLYVKIFAIKEDEVNDNGDAFSPAELKIAAPSFVGVPLFTNHQNDDVEKSRGECVHSWYDKTSGGIFIIGRVDKIAYPKLARGIEEGYITGCFPPDAPVLMSDGTEKNICDIEDGDYIISGKGNIKKVLGTRERGYNYPIVSIKVEGNKNPLVCTSHHNIMVYRVPSLCACGCEEELMIKKDSRITSKTFDREFKTGHNMRGKSPDFNHEYIKKIKAHELQDGDFLVEPKFIDYSCDDYITEEEAFLVGLFLAEGSYEKRNGERHAAIFSFAHTELETLAFQCEEKLKTAFASHRNSPTVNFYPEASQSRVNLYGKDIAQWFYERCGEYSDGKVLNSKLMKLSKEKTASLLAGFMEGDGYNVKEKYYGFGIVSGDLASQLRLLLEKIGVRTNYKIITEANGRYGYKPVHEVTFGKTTVPDLFRDRLIYKKAERAQVEPASWHSVEDYTLRRVRGIEEIDFNGTVYDIEVEDDHTYCVNHIAVSNTSMGCSVEYSICSVCHNKAQTSDEYCEHVASRKNKKYSGDINCKYHKSPIDTDDECPLCKSTKDASNSIAHDKQAIYEHNFGLKFIENSFVVNPACHDCGVSCILHVPELQKKVASRANAFKASVEYLIKNANNLDGESSNKFEKMGGVEELNLLKDSMGKLEMVVQSMLKQKENVSMDYVSELVKAMADLQATYDELNEMGYARLPSAIVGDASMDATTTGEAAPVVPQPMPTAQPAPTPAPSGSGSADMGGLGTITTPKQSSRKIEDFSAINQKLITKVSMLTDTLNNVIENINNTSLKEIGVDMAKNKETKVAAGSENVEVITEKQLEKKNTDLHPRTDSTYEGITESPEQIGGTEQSNDTTSDSPQVRQGTYETITEDQLGTTSAAVVRYDDTPDVITEKQWTEFSKITSSKVADDYIETITEDQLKQLLESHKFVGSYETITEDQLRGISMTDGLKRWANKDYSLSVMKVATAAIADAIADYQKSPEEIAKIASTIADNPEMRAKVAFLSVVNSLPHKTEDRKLLASKSAYFSKIASKDSSVSAIDALALAVAANGEFGMVAEDVFDSIAHAVRNKTVMAKVDDMVKTKLSSTDESKVVVSKQDAMAKAIIAMDRPEDGKYQIKATLEDIGVPITEKVAFYEGVKKFAQEFLEEEEGLGEETVGAVIKIQVGDNGELVIDVSADGEEIGADDIEGLIEGPIDDIDVEPEEGEVCEINSDSPEIENPEPCMADTREDIVKEAQMMGGEMGGMGGAAQAPGAGASVPGMPQEVAPMENLTEDPLAEEEGLDGVGEEPLPPGSICPACSSKDVDVISGKIKCNNCGSSGTIKVNLEMDNWADTTPSDGEDTEEAGFEGEGFEMPADEAGMDEGLGEMPAVAAMMKITPEMLTKLAESEIELGTVSPVSGTTNTMKLASGERVCLDTGAKYKVAFATSTDGKEVWAQWEWKPMIEGVNVKCASCDRAKQKFVKALSSVSLTEAQFDALDIKAKVETINTLKEAGSLNPIKTASKEGSVINDYKLAYGGYGDDFPIESCVEKLARRFGENALALSGPCEGKALAECVCQQLKKADIYTDKIAIKVAKTWKDCSGDEECVEDQIRNGYSLRQAASVCEALKVAVASPEDLLADELSNNDFGESNGEPDGPSGLPMEETIEDEVDPFADGDMGGGTVTLELPIDVVEQLDAQLDVALGEDPAQEEHHEDLDINGEVDIVEDAGIGEGVDEVVTPEDLGVGEEKPMMDMTESKPVDGIGVNFESEENNKGLSEPFSEKKVTVNVDPTLADTDYDFKEASNMKSRQGKVGSIGMDLTGVLAVLTAGEKEISQEKAQDSSDIGQYTAGENGSQMGHENETIPSAQKPSVPRDKATMGQEPDDLNPQDLPQPVIPSDNATMGHEDEAGLSGGDNRYTGGTDGQGKTELASADEDLMHMAGFGSASSGLSRLAERILEATKLEAPAPVADDKDIQPIKGKSTIGKEEAFDAKGPENTQGTGNASMIGHESETIGDRPDSPKDHPDVATGNAQMGQEELDSEKTTKDKGTVIAETDSGSESEAIRVAAKMLQAKMIEASGLGAKIQELKSYKPAQIKDIEKAIFAGKKGLDTASDGMSQAVIINEASSEKLAIKEAKAAEEAFKTSSKDELAKNLQSLFSLDQQNVDADNDEQIQLRRLYR